MSQNSNSPLPPLAQVLAALDMKQADFVGESHLYPSSISRWYHGDDVPRLIYAERIAHTLKQIAASREAVPTVVSHYYDAQRLIDDTAEWQRLYAPEKAGGQRVYGMGYHVLHDDDPYYIPVWKAQEILALQSRQAVGYLLKAGKLVGRREGKNWQISRASVEAEVVRRGLRRSEDDDE